MLFTKDLKITDYEIKQKKNSINMAASAYHVMSMETGNRIFKRDCIFTYTCIKQPIVEL